jgi:hypothetical protein
MAEFVLKQHEQQLHKYQDETMQAKAELKRNDEFHVQLMGRNRELEEEVKKVRNTPCSR